MLLSPEGNTASFTGKVLVPRQADSIEQWYLPSLLHTPAVGTTPGEDQGMGLDALPSPHLLSHWITVLPLN